MVVVKCIMEIEFSNRKKTLTYNDIEFIEEWCAENNITINRLIYSENKHIKTRRYEVNRKYKKRLPV